MASPTPPNHSQTNPRTFICLLVVVSQYMATSRTTIFKFCPKALLQIHSMSGPIQSCRSPLGNIEVRGMPNGIFHPWVRWDSGVEVAGKFFRRRRRRRRRRCPPPKGKIAMFLRKSSKCDDIRGNYRLK